MEAKVAALMNQFKQASDPQKARIEKRIAEARADYQARRAKLESAREPVHEAVVR